MNHSASGNFFGARDSLYFLSPRESSSCVAVAAWDGQSLAGKLHEAPLSVMCAISQEPPELSGQASRVKSLHLRLRLGNYRSLIICRCASTFPYSSLQLEFHSCHFCTISVTFCLCFYGPHILENISTQVGIHSQVAVKKGERLAEAHFR